ncbi:MAG: DUF2497 domain-containing protein [Pseudomonadota bacterium]
MNNPIKHPANQKPVGADMTMDEILSSIRKIISTDDIAEDNKMAQPAPVQEQSNAKPNPSAAVQKMRVPLSGREQLQNLSQNNHDDFSADIQSHHTVPYASVSDLTSDVRATSSSLNRQPPQRHLDSDVMTRPVEQRAASQNDVAQKSPLQNEDETAAILRTLNDIKQSLTAYDDKKSTPKPETKIDTPEQNNQALQTKRDIAATQMIDELKDISLSPEQMYQNIDFKPVHFGEDDIPAFLKKFKKEQDEAPLAAQQNMVPSHAESYDFSKMTGFDEDDSVMELTETVHPAKESKNSPQVAQAISSQAPMQHSLIASSNVEDETISDALEMLTIKTLRPMLREWMEENVERIAAKILREELGRRGRSSEK